MPPRGRLRRERWDRREVKRFNGKGFQYSHTSMYSQPSQGAPRSHRLSGRGNGPGTAPVPTGILGAVMKTFTRIRDSRRWIAGAVVGLLAASAGFAVSTTTSHAEEEEVEAQQTVRPMEDLGRGVVAVRSSSTSVLVSWRLLGLDPSGTGFNVYRSSRGRHMDEAEQPGPHRRAPTTPTRPRTSRSPTPTASPRSSGGAEQAPSGAFTLTANHADEPVVRIPLRNGGAVKFVWTGDLDGDGEYDYVIDRQTSPQSIEAYTSTARSSGKSTSAPTAPTRTTSNPAPPPSTSATTTASPSTTSTATASPRWP